MPLTANKHLETETLKLSVIVKEKLGEGGQGEVYKVDSRQGPFALKWYNRVQATPDQREALRYLVRIGPPRGPAGRRFIWPLDLVAAADESLFGYLMPLIDTRRYGELGQVWAHRRPAPGLPTLCRIGFQLANSYRRLHLSGHCYRDISAGNLMFDPETGDVLICDNDNVGIEKQSKSQVLGTWEYMAPELIQGEADPSAATDLYSLSVLLFLLWNWHHPLHGQQEYNIRCWDLPAKRRVYGEQPVFIFDPHDESNRLPDDPDYHTARRRWSLCPLPLQEHFVRAFTDGLKHPDRRVTEGEWQSLFRELTDCAISCSNCRAENLADLRQREIACWNCHKIISLPPRLHFDRAAGRHTLLLAPARKLLRWHIGPRVEEDVAEDVVAEVVQNPANPEIWGIRNFTDAPWVVTFSDGTSKQIPSQRAAPINLGMKLHMEGITATVAS